MGLWKTFCGIFSRKRRPIKLDIQIGRVHIDECEHFHKQIEVEPPQQKTSKYRYPCEEVDNGDGTITLQAIFVDCIGTLITGNVDNLEVYQPVLDLVRTLSIARRLPIVVWTFGSVSECQEILEKIGCYLSVYRRREGKNGDRIAVMVDDMSPREVEALTGLKPDEFLYVYDLFPELIDLNSA